MTAGKQLSGDELHRRQVAQNVDFSGPVIVCVGLSLPSNIGGVLRIADAMRCREVIFVDTPYQNSRRIRKVSRHMSDKLPHRFVSFAAFETMVEPLLPLVAIEITTESRNLYDTTLPADVTLVIGSERYGIPENVLKLCTQAVYLPMFGINSSMNVATSLGIVLYEWYRRTQSG